MLQERGVDSARELVAGMDDEDVAGVFGAIAMWDDMPHSGERAVSPGLLVKKIREGGVPGYKRPHERTQVDEVATSSGGFMAGGAITDETERRLRRMIVACAMDRDEAREWKLLRDLAEASSTRVDALIDTVMSQDWQECPPHPANSCNWRGRWVFPAEQDPMAEVRYAALCMGAGRRFPAEPALTRLPGESDWAFAVRYWGWEDEPEWVERVREARAVAEERREAAAAAAEAERAETAEVAAALSRGSVAVAEPDSPPPADDADDPW